MISAAEAFEELMRLYDKNRSCWISEKGNADGFDEWFTEQVLHPMEI